MKAFDDAVNAAFGTLAPAVGASCLPFTPGTKAVLKRALALVAAERARPIESRHLLLALLERKEPDPAAEILAGLHIDKYQTRVRVNLHLRLPSAARKPQMAGSARDERPVPAAEPRCRAGG